MCKELLVGVVEFQQFSQSVGEYQLARRISAWASALPEAPGCRDSS
jgi:hypothetical protein